MNPAQRNTVKITVKDLPLHSVSNQDILDAVKEYCPVYSEVKYSNIWHNGKATSICNGDRFLYISQSDLAKLPKLLDVSTYKARVFKHLVLTKCKRCGTEGHRPSDPKCPARMTEEMADMIETFKGEKLPLSNLHCCNEGCEIQDRGTLFRSSEHHYQFKKLKAHDKGEEAYLLLAEEKGFQAMKKAQQVLLESKVSDEWKASAQEEMLETCHLKFTSYPYAQECLLETRITLAEVTRDPFWGTGLTVQQTHEYLPDFWPSKNMMGEVLIEICGELSLVEEKKCKASSPLESDQVKLAKS